MTMRYNYVKRQFHKQRLKKSLRLLKLTRVIYYLLSFLNWMEGVIVKLMCILLGFQYDIYLKLREVTYDNSYLDNAKMVEYQIRAMISALGE